MEINELNNILEGFLPSYTIEGIIIQNKDGSFNILNADKEKMLERNYGSLKQMLLDIAREL